MVFEEELNQRLSVFSGHGLADLEHANLMNRVDTKFVIPVNQLFSLIGELQQLYSVLEIRGKRFFAYHSTYFDTEDFSLYHLHHNKHLNRHKVRVRHYVDDDSYFLEVKFKTNKKRTIKNRIPVSADCPLAIENHRDFLQLMGLAKNMVLKPSLISQYKRIAFASEVRQERLTLDFDLTKYSLMGSCNRLLGLDDIVVAELKQSKLNRHSPFFQLARKYNFRSTSFSKYCLGIALTMPEYDVIKSNRFKPIARKVATTLIEEV